MTLTSHPDVRVLLLALASSRSTPAHQQFSMHSATPRARADHHPVDAAAQGAKAIADLRE
jgi:hypothetical protein